MRADPIGRPLVCVQLAQWHASRQAILHTAGAPFARCHVSVCCCALSP